VVAALIADSIVPGSFRDPRGYVFAAQDRIFRSITRSAIDDYRFVQGSGLLQFLMEKRWLIDTWDADPAQLGLQDAAIEAVVEHAKLPFVSHPYEWSFSQLRAAALHHLDLHLCLLERGVTLSDASAYNVQFLGARPVFIDLLSLRRYQEGEFWLGHKQFCEQFLNPLLLRAWFGISHNDWYRGALEGIAAEHMAALTPWSKRLSFKVLSHVVLPAKLQQRSGSRTPADLGRLRERKLPLRAFRSLLMQLRAWIASLKPADSGPTVWEDYTKKHTYESSEHAAKREFIADFARANGPEIIWDLGCNTGEYSALALESGARYAVGFDFDPNALEAAYARAVTGNLPLLALHLDAANPAPDQGWRNRERDGLLSRARADALLALAFEHHLAIGRNVPLDQVVAWLVGLAPKGVIEWVEKTDSTVQRMLALREDIFERYNRNTFEEELRRNCRIVKSAAVSEEGRRLYWYDRSI
jgi:ribosomal protein L11 methylase PrmA